jgi:hypothetical protein
MLLEKNELLITKAEACLLACKLRGQVPPGFIPDDPDTPAAGPDDPDLASCAASYLENGGAVRVKAPEKKPVEAPALKDQSGHGRDATKLEPKGGKK